MKRRPAMIGGAVVVGVGVAVAFAIMWRPAIPEMAAIPSFDHALVVKGAQLAAIGDCAVCHAGVDGHAYAGGRPLETPFGAIYPTNITPDPDTGIGRWSLAAFRRSMQSGVDRKGRFLYPAFPYNHYTHVTDTDVEAIYAFLLTREPVRAIAPPPQFAFPMNIRSVVAGWNLLFLDYGGLAVNMAHDTEWNRGEYLVEGLGHCQACHSPHNVLGAEEHGHAFAGGQAEGWEGPALSAASPAAIPWSADAIFRYLRHGLDDQHAAAAGPMNAVSHDLTEVPEADVHAMATYIASLTVPPDPAREQAVVAKAAASQVPPPALQASAGAAIFAGACAGCHGAGAPMMLNGRPSLALGSSVTAVTARNATQTILNGLQPQPGERGPWMPPFAGSLTDGQVAAVLVYLRTRFTDLPTWTGLEDSVKHIRQGSSS